MLCICIYLGLSLRNTKALEPFAERSYVAIWYWIQEFNSKDIIIFPNKKREQDNNNIYHR
jgi:hypothetical protein